MVSAMYKSASLTTVHAEHLSQFRIPPECSIPPVCAP